MSKTFSSRMHQSEGWARSITHSRRGARNVEIVKGSHGDADVVNEAFSGADAVFWLNANELPPVVRGHAQARRARRSRHSDPPTAGASSHAFDWPHHSHNRRHERHRPGAR
ncbi:hypothetical protein AGR1_23790 [Agrobacterium sp. B1(2019)]|nr:hypothetical protein AGR1_23790 [Agrobacterium sp. B1(2019)]